MRWAGLVSIVALLLVAGLAGWQWSLYRPQHEAVQEGFARAIDRLADAQRAESERAELEQQIAEREALLRRLREEFPEALGVDAFRELLTRTARGSGAEVGGFSATSTQHEFYEEATISAELRGSSSAIDAAMAALFLEPRYVDWHEDPSPAGKAERDEQETSAASTESPDGVAGPETVTESLKVGLSIFAIAPSPAAGRRSCRVAVADVWLPPFSTSLSEAVTELNETCTRLDELSEVALLVDRYEDLLVQTGAIQAVRESIFSEHRFR